MFPEHFSFSRIRTRRSSALVITLAALVLICAILLVFFNQSTLNRQISFSSAGQYRADLVAHTALDATVGDLRTEIAAGSTNSINGLTNTVNGITIYVPTTDATVVPYRVADQDFPNLVKQSASTSNFWTGTYFDSSVFNPVRSAANNSTQTPSANGRYINTKQWNKPGLLGDPGSGAVPAIPNNYVPPDWVLVTRQGAVTNATTLPAVGPGTGTLSDKSAGNGNYVVGRYAYTIYDEGGLLDVNVAGFPGSVSGTDFTTKRGLLPQVDLANIPGIGDANALVQWRNQASAASATSYTNYFFTVTNGFTTVVPGDQAFVSRKDLIHYALANPSVLSTSALPYLGTFTRELNAPSYTPPVLGSSNRPRTQEGNQIGKDDQFNPSLINTRVTTSFKRLVSDGTLAQVGEPLIKYRFPLSRLNWIGNTGPTGTKLDGTAVSNADTLNSFGLTWTTFTDSWSGAVTSGWIYNHGNSSQILTLAQVASAAREPDFFELLQAGILVGSIGKVAADVSSTVSALDVNNYDQIIQIGANLVDQYDTDSFPTHISFDNRDFYGIENLPYLVRVFQTPYRFHGRTQPPNDPNAGVWYQPEIWNPHVQAGMIPSSPAQFRFITSGAASAIFHTDTSPATYAISPVNNFANPTGITFSTSTVYPFNAPTLLSSSVGAAASGNDHVTDDGFVNFLGIWIGTADAPDQRLDSTAPDQYLWSGTSPQPNVTYQLQYQDGGKWVTYDVIRYATSAGGCLDDVNPVCFEAYDPRVFLIRSDPRTDRFGVGLGANAPSTSETIRPNASIGYEVHGSFMSPGWFFPGPQLNPPLPTLSAYLGCLSDNTTTSGGTYYADPDSIFRRGEGAYAQISNPGLGGFPLATDPFNSANSRPIVLNRPFRSVADMGYASRGLPWKHLDLFTTESADIALLDLFCVNEPALPSPPTVLQTAAGLLNLNTRQQPVLAAVLTGAIKSDSDGTTITGSEATTLAAALTNLTINSTQGPLLNRAELASRFAPLITYANPTDAIIKRRREAAIRALSDVGNTRTWNLLIDVIAQSGRYTSSATNLNQFTVDGEHRYWLHVAIDRYSGKVLQQYLEPVYD